MSIADRPFVTMRTRNIPLSFPIATQKPPPIPVWPLAPRRKAVIEARAARLYRVFRDAITGEHAFSGEGDMPDLEKLDPVVHEAWLKVAEESMRGEGR